jgi:hypothetical protein
LCLLHPVQNMLFVCDWFLIQLLYTFRLNHFYAACAVAQRKSRILQVVSCHLGNF